MRGAAQIARDGCLVCRQDAGPCTLLGSIKDMTPYFSVQTTANGSKQVVFSCVYCKNQAENAIVYIPGEKSMHTCGLQSLFVCLECYNTQGSPPLIACMVDGCNSTRIALTDSQNEARMVSASDMVEIIADPHNT